MYDYISGADLLNYSALITNSTRTAAEETEVREQLLGKMVFFGNPSSEQYPGFQAMFEKSGWENAVSLNSQRTSAINIAVLETLAFYEVERR